MNRDLTAKNAKIAKRDEEFRAGFLRSLCSLRLHFFGFGRDGLDFVAVFQASKTVGLQMNDDEDLTAKNAKIAKRDEEFRAGFLRSLCSLRLHLFDFLFLRAEMFWV